MHCSFRHRVFVTAILAAAINFASVCLAGEKSSIEVDEQPGKLEIRIAGQPFATYVYRDDKTLRPYFSNVRSPSGIQVTRNHPPQPNVDPTDHAELHPGIWLAFADINGADFWRNKGRVEHAEFIAKPTIQGDQLTFTVRNRYVAGEKTVCTEICRHTIAVRPVGYLLLYDSEFSSPETFSFGDQEEFGLGLRVASPLRVKGEGSNGRMLASDGKQNEKEVRGSTADWVDYSGTIDGKQVGLTLMPDPRNFRRCWYHARDYGFIAANPFGRNALTGGPKSVVTVKPGEKFRLRFGVLIHSSPANKPIDLKAAYVDYLQQAK